MDNTDEILKSMVRDLQIWQYNGEEDAKFIARVVYSAISMWIRVSTLDESIFQQSEDQVGVSKVHILKRCQPFLDSMIEYYPEIQGWFYPEEQKERPIEIIRERLYNAGELVDIGFNSDLALPCYSVLRFNENVKISRGLKNNDSTNMAGIGRYFSTDYANTSNLENIWSFYGLDKKESKEYLLENSRNIKWQKANSDEWEVFDKSSKSSFSSSWGRNFKLKANEITLYRKGINDYGFIKNINNENYYSPISQYLIDQHEVYRFMYGLKAGCGNSATGYFKIYLDDEMVVIYLHSWLPGVEEKILLLLGWPVDNIYDKCKLIFSLAIWEFILKVLENLNINLQEVK